MHIWVDADACPRPVKEVLYRAAQKRQVHVTLVANQYLSVPKSPYLQAVQVAKGFDVADNEIVQRVAPGDTVITADIPLADEVISKGAVVVNPRGMAYTAANIKDHLQRRDMMEQLRDTGMVSGGPPRYDKQDLSAFANALDRLITRAQQA
ncbi:MAG: YaiI/YqxD family protein [Pseudomonadota bacterium]